MGLEETFKKYKWMIPIISNAERDIRSILMKNFRTRKKNFYPQGDYKADVDNLIKCMLCPNMCRFDCGTLQAASKETMSPAYKARIGYYITMGLIDPTKEENKDFIDLMYKCTNEENCKVWCPFDFSVVSLLESVRDDLNDKGLMPDYCKAKISNLHETGTIENYNIFKTYKEKGIENISSNESVEVFYYVGCEMMKFPDVVNANIRILRQAGIKFSVEFEKRNCCGAVAFNVRDMKTAKDFAEKNANLLSESGAKIIVSDCPGCVLTLTERYEKLGVKIDAEIIHIANYFSRLIDEGKLSFKKELQGDYNQVTIHDPCLLARNLKDTTSIRKILGEFKHIKIIEPIHTKDKVHCCGWSGTAQLADRDLAIKEASNRISELIETGSNIIVSACPLCELGLGYGLNENNKEKIKIIDLSEILIKQL